ncbi:peptidoglycan DD-metalloendopeptidase family protein [Flavobacterium rakeshii]|uniref:Peptidoglycan DD-metalloendopeptidase family protein n=1 Tax=Flavobacterium rakeshii TaxID=1038845 RepID=A0A6N8HCZ8_9FLAO|nr:MULTISPECIES: M23 family metallopeptidase [Flavobacterium]MUV03166.1 peptidoglycan DD-metalloendopeptidase family protein [Flavobacterium rakeshii]
MAAKKIIYIGVAATLILILMSNTNKALAAITKKQKIRGCDPLGCGSFGARRGTHTHQGIDIIATPGEDIYSPITGKVTRIAYPYASDLSYTGVEIVNEKYKVKMFYMSPTVAIPSVVTAGNKIGVAQNISAKHGAAMTNHVHIEVRNSLNQLIDPTDLF